MDHWWITSNGGEPLIQDEFDEERLNITDLDVKSAITRLTFRATVKLTFKLKHHLNLSRQRIKSRTQQA